MFRKSHIPWFDRHETTDAKKKKQKAFKQHTYGGAGGEEVLLLLILELGIRWGWVVSITPQPRFTPGERTPDTHWTGGWIGPRAGMDPRG
jgi:hypothetical protein